MSPVFLENKHRFSLIIELIMKYDYLPHLSYSICKKSQKVKQCN